MSPRHVGVEIFDRRRLATANARKMDVRWRHFEKTLDVNLDVAASSAREAQISPHVARTGGDRLCTRGHTRSLVGSNARRSLKVSRKKIVELAARAFDRHQARDFSCQHAEVGSEDPVFTEMPVGKRLTSTVCRRGMGERQGEEKKRCCDGEAAGPAVHGSGAPGANRTSASRQRKSR